MDSESMGQRARTRRIFVAVEIPPGLRESVARLPRTLATARWMNPQQLHITLLFIGSTQQEPQEAIERALSRIVSPAFTLKLAEFGAFPDVTAGRVPRVLWIQPGRSSALTALQSQVATAVRTATGVETQRAFSPHVTLARFRRPPTEAELAKWLDDAREFESDSFEVNRFHLYDSDLTPNGAVHTILATYPLS
jgi:2'-5' RNA ligase